VLGLPRGGVIVASEVAKALVLPLDVVVARKVGAPDNPEFAIGAVSEEGEGVFDPEIIALYNISQEYIDKEIKKGKEEASRRLKKFHGDRVPLNLFGKTAILVDDGVATGSTMQAAILLAKTKGAKKIIVAVPVIAQDSLKLIREEVDESVYLDAPMLFGADGQFYKMFSQTTDEEVVDLLND